MCRNMIFMLLNVLSQLCDSYTVNPIHPYLWSYPYLASILVPTITNIVNFSLTSVSILTYLQISMQKYI